MSNYATTLDILEKELFLQQLNNKYLISSIEKPDINFVIRTYNNYQCYLQVIDILPKYLNQIIKIEYVYFDKLILIINNIQLTDKNINEIIFILKNQKKFGFYDKFNYSTLDKSVILI
jgi:hypothetical protein